MSTDLLHTLTLGDMLREHARSLPRKTATVCEGSRYTYPELDTRTNKLAHALSDAGVQAGDRVLWLGQNSHRVLELLLASAKLGATFCPANWRQSAEELAFVIDDADAKVIVAQREEIGDRVRDARKLSTSDGLWIVHDDAQSADLSYEDFLATGDHSVPAVDVHASSPVLMIYTAAFTGRPNGALISHQAINAHVLASFSGTVRSGDAVFLNSGPLFHIGTLATTLGVFHFGGTNVFTRRVDAEEICRLVDAEKCNTAFMLSATVDDLQSANQDGKYDLSSLDGTFERMADATTAMFSCYGQTELMGLVTELAPGAIGTHGRPKPIVQMRIVDESDDEVAVGEVGEIAVRGPVVMVGYHNRPDENAHRLRNGWHHTNDIGRRELDGSITFVGPKLTIIKSGVENIYPAEVESCITKHPAVREVCVIGVPDDRWIQRVKAVVVLQPAQTVTEDEIIEHCRSSIASYKKPSIVEFVDALPRAASGFVDRAAVDAEFGGGNYPGAGTRSV